MEKKCATISRRKERKFSCLINARIFFLRFLPSSKWFFRSEILFWMSDIEYCRKQGCSQRGVHRVPLPPRWKIYLIYFPSIQKKLNLKISGYDPTRNYCVCIDKKAQMRKGEKCVKCRFTYTAYAVIIVRREIPKEGVRR